MQMIKTIVIRVIVWRLPILLAEIMIVNIASVIIFVDISL